MEHFFHDGEAERWLPTQAEIDAGDNNALVKEYNDQKALTGCLVALIALTGIIFLCAVIYSFTTLFIYLIDIASKIH
jgi:hypothetical protein